MLKLRTLLLSNKLFYVIVIISIMITIIRLNIVSTSCINIEDHVVSGKVTNIKYDGNKANNRPKSFVVKEVHIFERNYREDE